MTKMEYEKKVLLTEKEYLALLGRFQYKQEPIIQINHYYDTDYFTMDRNGVTCRIREKNGKLKATMKYHRQNNMYCSEEVEMFIHDGLIENDFTIMGLFYQGSLKTTRTVVSSNDCCKIMLDRNEYLGIVDYELEAEFPADRERDAMRIVWEIISTLNINDGVDMGDPTIRMTSETKSKSERFFGRKRALSDCPIRKTQPVNDTVRYEKRLLLTQEEYETLVLYFGQESKKVELDNEYFDTPYLDSCDIGTYYYIQKINGRYDTVQEDDPKDDLDIIRERIAHNQSDLNVFRDIDMCSMGKMHIERIPLVDSELCSMFVDRCSYTFVDFELVISYDLRSKEQAERFLSLAYSVLSFFNELREFDAFVKRSKECDIKAKRFMESKKRLIYM